MFNYCISISFFLVIKIDCINILYIHALKLSLCSLFAEDSLIAKHQKADETFVATKHLVASELKVASGKNHVTGSGRIATYEELLVTKNSISSKLSGPVQQKVHQFKF